MNKLLLFSLGFVMFAGVAGGEQTTGEKVKAGARTTGRQIKKATNRVQEAVCLESDLECAAKKAKNRLNEAGSAVKDKAVEVKDKVD